MRSRPTVSDVAWLCGVTPSTVRRVLNKKATFSTSPAVRRRIFDTAHQLGYVLDLAARNLNQRTTRVIGVFASPMPRVLKGSDEPLIEGIQEVLHASDDISLGLIAATSRDSASGRRSFTVRRIRRLKSRPARGSASARRHRRI